MEEATLTVLTSTSLACPPHPPPPPPPRSAETLGIEKLEPHLKAIADKAAKTTLA